MAEQLTAALRVDPRTEQVFEWPTVFSFVKGKIISMTNSEWNTWKVENVSDTVKLLLTKNPACSCNFPWCQVHGISLERFPRHWQTVGPIAGPSRVADSTPRGGVLFRSYAVTGSLAQARLMSRRVPEANLHLLHAA